jgi:hypothetical protein
MDRYAKQISTGKIVHIQSGGDSNRPQLMSDSDWEALMATRLDTVRQQAINQGIPSNDLEVGWSDKVERQNFKIQIAAEAESLKTYADKRRDEYPTIEELVVALYDTDDKADVDRRRAEVKAKYPKP